MNFKQFGRTANLFDGSLEQGTTSYGDLLPATNRVRSNIFYLGAGTFTFSCANSEDYRIGLDYHSSDGTYVDGTAWLTTKTFDVTNSAPQIRLKIKKSNEADFTPQDINDVMLNTGSQPLPYEPYGSTWHDTPHYIMGTSIDTLTTLPADIYANDTTATVGLKGNMSQSSQPSPTTPIQPSECGERTGNEWNVTILPNSSLTEYNYWDKYDAGTISTTMYMPCEGNTTYYLYTPDSITSGIFRVYTSVSNSIPVEGQQGIPVVEKARYSTPVSSFSFTTGANDKMIIVQVTTANSQTMADNAVLDKGYKIPILSGGVTTPVYLGEVQSTRRIKKYEFTGQEDWTYSASGNKKRVYVTGFDRAQLDASSLCSHFVNTDYVSYPDSGKFAINASSPTQTMIFGVTDMAITSATDWTTYLAQQYAAGTPVCVWYVLATPTTGIVNEPLRKIGDYADTVSGITIPTIAGANTISIGTTLQPSEVTATYKGWHPVQSVHERESGAWD